jgi:hypothetical protein
MAVNPRDLDKFRADARAGGTLLTPEERIKLLKVCLQLL